MTAIPKVLKQSSCVEEVIFGDSFPVFREKTLWCHLQMKTKSKKERENTSNLQENRVGGGVPWADKGASHRLLIKGDILRETEPGHWVGEKIPDSGLKKKRSYLTKVARSGQNESGQENNRIRIMVILEGERPGEPEDHPGWCQRDAWLQSQHRSSCTLQQAHRCTFCLDELMVWYILFCVFSWHISLL